MPSYLCADPRDPDRTLDVDFDINSHGSSPITFGPPEYCDPGESAEITILKVFDENEADVLSILTTEQVEAVEAAVLENYDFGSAADFDDFDPRD